MSIQMVADNDLRRLSGFEDRKACNVADLPRPAAARFWMRWIDVVLFFSNHPARIIDELHINMGSVGDVPSK